MLLILAPILDPFRMLRLFRKWDKEMDSNREDKTSYTTQHQEAFLKYVKNEYCAKDRRLPVSKPESVTHNILFSPAIASRSGQSSYNSYDLPIDDEE